MLFWHKVRLGWSPVPCRPQMGQEMVWPTQRHTIQRFDSLYLVEIGMHWKLTTRATGFLQINAVLPQSQTRVVTSALSAPDGPGNGVAHPKRYHTACWQPVLSGNRPALETKHPCGRNSANQSRFSTESDQVDHQCPVGPRWSRKWCGPPKDIPYSVLAACTRLK